MHSSAAGSSGGRARSRIAVRWRSASPISAAQLLEDQQEWLRGRQRAFYASFPPAEQELAPDLLLRLAALIDELASGPDGSHCADSAPRSPKKTHITRDTVRQRSPRVASI